MEKMPKIIKQPEIKDKTEILEENNENVVNKKEKPEVKEGVDFIFEQNPELSQIGTKEQYSEYLDTIFPESMVKDIVYHGTNNIFKKFDETKFGETDPGSYGKGIYFTKSKGYAERLGDKIMYSLVNFKNPLTVNYLDETSALVFGYKTMEEVDELFDKWLKVYSGNEEAKEQIKNYRKIITPEFLHNVNEHDGVIVLDNDEKIWEITAPYSEPIHILGSEEDIENFRKFVSKN